MKNKFDRKCINCSNKAVYCIQSIYLRSKKQIPVRTNRPHFCYECLVAKFGPNVEIYTDYNKLKSRIIELNSLWKESKIRIHDFILAWLNTKAYNKMQKNINLEK